MKELTGITLAIIALVVISIAIGMSLTILIPIEIIKLIVIAILGCIGTVLLLIAIHGEETCKCYGNDDDR